MVRPNPLRLWKKGGGAGESRTPDTQFRKTIDVFAGFQKFWILIDSFSSCKTDELTRIDSF